MTYKKSVSIPATLTIVMAGLAGGCMSQRRCVDARGQIVADQYCIQPGTPLPPPNLAPAHWDNRSYSGTNRTYFPYGGSSGISRGGFGGFSSGSSSSS